LLANIEQATKQKVEEMQLPSTEFINNTRINKFKQRITDTLAAEELSFYSQLINQYQVEHDVPALDIAAALAKLMQGDTPLLLKELSKKPRKDSERERERSDDRRGGEKERGPKRERGRAAAVEMEMFRIEVGHSDGVKPGNIVGAIANETGIDGDHIARIKIEENYSTVELPAGMPKDLFQALKKVRVVGKPLNISKYDPSLVKKDKSKKRMSSTSVKRKKD
jgi:ATP-dependent RNA helicase DeaD